MPAPRASPTGRKQLQLQPRDPAPWAAAPGATPDRDGRAREAGKGARAVLPTLMRWAMLSCPRLFAPIRTHRQIGRAS